MHHRAARRYELVRISLLKSVQKFNWTIDLKSIYEKQKKQLTIKRKKIGFADLRIRMCHRSSYRPHAAVI